MDCLEAQRLISEQLDREPPDPEQLELAKQHCRACPECGSYVRALVLLRQSPLPEPPPGLVDRVMDAVAGQAATQPSTRVVAAAPAPMTTPAETDASSPPAGEISLDRLVATVKARRHRKAVMAWAATFLLVFVVSGAGAIAGLRTIFAPPQTQMSGDGSATMYASEAPGIAEQSAPPSPGVADAERAAPGSAPNYIAVGQVVYRETGEASNVNETALVVVGSTSTALGGPALTTRDVRGTDDPSEVYVTNDDGMLMAFERVTRTFRGAVYVLTSGQLTRYGEWPTLPAGLPQPTNPDGAPEYVSAGTDSRGVAVYRQANGDASAGIAVPPGTAASDPAAGNPNWSWWRPAR